VACEEDIVPIRKIISRRPSAAARGFTLIELQGADRDSAEPVAQKPNPVTE
jgi:hypothetical protein